MTGAERLERLRQEHARHSDQHGSWCHKCYREEVSYRGPNTWPCDAARLVAALTLALEILRIDLESRGVDEVLTELEIP